MLKSTFFIIFSLAFLNLSAQPEAVKEKYSFKERKFFQQTRAGWIQGVSPSFPVQRVDQNGEVLREFRAATMIVSLGGAAYEPRLNLVDFSDRGSISISVPFDLSLGLSITTPNDGINTGFFAATTGLFFDANLGNHSTYNNVDKNGYAIGIGYRLFKAPLFGIPEGGYKYKRISSGLAVRIQYKKDMRNNVNKLFYFETGIPQRFDAGDNQRQIANVYINVGVGKLINY